MQTSWGAHTRLPPQAIDPGGVQGAGVCVCGLPRVSAGATNTRLDVWNQITIACCASHTSFSSLSGACSARPSPHLAACMRR